MNHQGSLKEHPSKCLDEPLSVLKRSTEHFLKGSKEPLSLFKRPSWPIFEPPQNIKITSFERPI
jgi:hypothetical protein